MCEFDIAPKRVRYSASIVSAHPDWSHGMFESQVPWCEPRKVPQNRRLMDKALS